MLTCHLDVFGHFARNRAKLGEVIEEVGTLLRVAWRRPDLRTRDWWVFTARQAHARAVNDIKPIGTRAAGSWIIGPPPKGSSLDHAALFVPKMSYCENSECKDRYFFRGKRKEKYCSAKCKRKFRRAANLKSWNKTGKQRRRAHAKKKFST